MLTDTNASLDTLGSHGRNEVDVVGSVGRPVLEKKRNVIPLKNISTGEWDLPGFLQHQSKAYHS